MADHQWLLLELAVSIPETAVCLAPDCTNPCDWVSRRGPRQMYCSRTCSQRTRATRERLEDGLAILRDKVLPELHGPVAKDALDIEARILWILRRYPAPGWEE